MRPRRRMRRPFLCAATFALIGSMRAAHANEPPLDAARQAYDRGATAFDNKDYATAARELARADDLVPNNVALVTALKAALRADDAVLGMTLAERADE